MRAFEARPDGRDDCLGLAHVGAVKDVTEIIRAHRADVVAGDEGQEVVIRGAAATSGDLRKNGLREGELSRQNKIIFESQSSS